MKKLAIISSLLFGLTLTSCDSYLDINENPNSPDESTITTSTLLPAAEMNLAASYGDYLRIVGGYFSEHYAQDFGTSNYLDYSAFTMSATRSSSTYTQLNSRALKSLETIRTKSSAAEEWGTYLAATTLRAFIYQILVDCYGEVPYTEAFQGEANMSPKYDDGQTIYDGVLAELDEALSKVDGSEPVATSMLFPDEGLDPWIKFANAVKLKMLTRESGVASVDSKIAELINENNFPDDDVAFTGCWKNESGQMSPFYAEEISSAWGSTQQNVCLNVALLGTMQQKDAQGNVVYDDPRLPAYFSTNGSGAYTGGISGTNFSTSKSYKASYWCRPVGSYDMPVYLITKFEIEFFIAEYYAKQGNSSQATSHYNAAIEASFKTMGVGGAADYIANFPLDMSNYKKSIGIAKWVALAGVNNFESWCELRRLDYPAFGSVKGSDMYDLQTDDSYNPDLYVAGTLYTPIQVFGQVGENKLLERFPYAESSSARNGNTPTFPGYTSPVFWGN